MNDPLPTQPTLPPPQPPSGCRKRVQSQIITSGKRTERSFRRNSTEYCLLAATLGCTANDEEHYRSVLREAQDEEAAKNDRRADAALLKQAAVERVSSAKEVALERLSDSSLHNFVKRVSSRRAISPLACLFDFVAHTSMHVSDVFCSDPGGSLVMSTCLLDCKLFWFGSARLSSRRRGTRSLRDDWSFRITLTTTTVLIISPFSQVST